VIGLHLGVARPQDKLSRYINMVKDVGTIYRSAGGSGYSSNAELDFHVDSGEVVLLSCYNQAPSGGDSLYASSVAAFRQLAAERWNCSMRSCGGPSSCTPGAASSAPAGSSIPRSATTRALPEFQQHLLGGMAWAMRMELPYR